VLFLGIVVFQPGRVFANMASPVQPGDPVGEPSGDLKQIAIAREVLDLDLRPLANDQPAMVSATYAVRNEGPAQALDLLFVAPGLVGTSRSDVAVWLDNASVPATIAPNQKLPASWQPPATTPGLEGSGPLTYQTRNDRVVRFSLALPAGSHQVRVRYSARATAHSGNSPVRYWQLGYVLAPAKNWAGFGALDVSVEVPPGWPAATRPELTRQGDVLKGTFEGVPADSLAITVQAPVPPQGLGIDPAPALAVVGLAMSLALGFLAGRWLARRHRSFYWSFLVAVVATGAWFLLSIVALAIQPPGATAPSGQEAWTYGYGHAYVGLGLMFAAILVAPIACLAAALLAFRKGDRRREVGG
jgi:hypothetical protein